MPTATPVALRQAEYLLVEAELPGRTAEVIGVLLYDPAGSRLSGRFRRDWDSLAEEDEAEVLSELARDLEVKIAEFGGESCLAWLEEALSNAIRISERREVLMAGFESTLNRLYRENVPSTVLPHQTHLPVYSLRAAAGKWGEQMAEEVEPHHWVEAPEDLRLHEGMFVAQVVGHSMEPVIPDGAWCVFRAPVVGSRENKRVLVVNHDESEQGGERYTVKRYRSHKVRREGGSWEHDRILFEPLNPSFPSWEILPGQRVEVIAEFLRVL
jgi:phage repressor protein C with HTH and peptisase S24 domain